MLRRLTFLVLCLAVSLAVEAAEAAARRALVVGINAYENVKPLEKAVGDAGAISERLRSLGFEVDVALDADRRSLNRAISTFTGKIQPGDTVLFHFSGHGVEIDRQNYLLPADVPDPKPGEKEFVKAESVSLGALTDSFARTGAAIRIFVIDACRDNPFSEQATRSLGSAVGRGLARPTAEPEGTFILFSAGYGQTALDRLGESDPSPTSVFTRILLEELAGAGVSLNDLAEDVRVKVAALAGTVGHTQTPAVYDEVTGQYYLTPPDGAGTAPTAGNGAAPVPPDAEAYGLAQSIGTREAWQAFIDAYPGTFRARLAAAEIARLDAAAKAEAERLEAERLELARLEAEREEAERLEAERRQAERRRKERQEAALQDARMKGRVQDFVAESYLPGVNAGADEVAALFADRVDYYGRKGLTKKEVLADKRAYYERFASLAYDLVPGTLDVAKAGEDWRATFQTDFEAVDATRRVTGRAETTLVLVEQGGVLRVRSENGKTLKRNEVALIDPEPEPEPENSGEAEETSPPAETGPVATGSIGFWQHNGSTMYLEASGADRSFVYYEPRSILEPAGVRRGTVLFKGRKNGNRYAGEAYLFSRFCPPFVFDVEGPITNASKTVRLRGRAPVRDRSCTITGWQEEELVFTYLRRGSL